MSSFAAAINFAEKGKHADSEELGVGGFVPQGSLANYQVFNRNETLHNRDSFPDVKCVGRIREGSISSEVEAYPLGFPRLAALQNSSSDLAIFRRFGVAHCRVLLHLQCEITSLTKELDELDVADSHENSGMLYRLRRNEWHEGWDTAQKDLLEKLKCKLSEYDDLLLKDRNLRNLESPRSQHYKSLFNWIVGYKPLDGGEYGFLFHRNDFVSCMESNHESRFDEVIEWVLSLRPGSKIFQKIVGKKSEGTSKKIPSAGVYTFSRTKTTIVAKVLALVVAFTILLMPVILLYLKPMGNGARAAMILVFVPAFAILMSLFLMARVEAVFIGTCTYCAVLVTFLGNVGMKDCVCTGSTC